MKVNENTVISLPIRNLLFCGRFVQVCMLTSELTARLTKLETSRDITSS